MKTLLIIFSVLLFGCAGQRPPTGGDFDTTPPEIINYSPENLTTNAKIDKIILEFNEYVDKRSVEESIFISPRINNYDFEWDGKTLEIILKEELQNNVTYVLRIGTDVVDLNNRNRMEKSFSLAFSTGPKIDNGVIHGKVYGEQNDGITIFAYRNLNFDTLKISKIPPNFITQTGKDGTFEFTNLANGNYRIFAVKDEFRNLLYDTETDEIGISQNNILLTTPSSVSQFISFILFKEDTTKPRLIDVESVDKTKLKLIFSEPISDKALEKSIFYLLNIKNEKIKNYSSPLLSKNSKEILLFDNFVEENFKIKVENIYDLFGNEINELISDKEVKLSNSIDTIKPEIIFSNLNDNHLEKEDVIVLQFNEKISYDGSGTKIIKNEIIEIPFDYQFHLPSTIKIFPKENNSNDSYKLILNSKSITDLSGNNLKDSILIFNFNYIDDDKYGSIKGIVKQTSNIFKKVVIVLEKIGEKQKFYSSKIDERNEFSFERVLSGEYKLTYFIDENENLIFDKGKLFPFIHSEKYYEHNSKIKIRANWPLEGLILNLF